MVKLLAGLPITLKGVSYISVLRLCICFKTNLLFVGVPIHWADSHGWCALHVAVLQNNLDLLDYLISTKTNLNYRNRVGWSALHVAVKKGHLEMVQTLVEVNM